MRLASSVLVCCGPFLFICSLMPGAATAQDDTQESGDPDPLYAEGAEALHNAQFARARDVFREVLERDPTGGAAYNLGLALRGTGESLEAIEVFEDIIEGEYGAVPDETRARIERWIVEERGALATLAISIRGADSAEVRVGARELGNINRGDPTDVHVNAGAHVVRARAEGFVTAEQTVNAERAASHDIDLMLEPLPSSGVFEEPAFWIVTGSVLVAATALTVVLLMGPYENDPIDSDPLGIARALSGPSF